MDDSGDGRGNKYCHPAADFRANTHRVRRQAGGRVLALGHSFRHSLRDRLRHVECPSDIADAIGGWATTSVGQKYGSGYGLEVKAKWIAEMISD